jgi:hypothetical protein
MWAQVDSPSLIGRTRVRDNFLAIGLANVTRLSYPAVPQGVSTFMLTSIDIHANPAQATKTATACAFARRFGHERLLGHNSALVGSHAR